MLIEKCRASRAASVFSQFSVRVSLLAYARSRKAAAIGETPVFPIAMAAIRKTQP